MKKIVIIGPESTGKSTLTEALALHYNTRAVKEYAREYLSQKRNSYTFEDLYEIAQGQLAAEDKMCVTDNEFLFIDTNFYVIKVWSEFVFNKCDNRILSEIARRKYDGYLLCDVDLPWIADELREYPDLHTRQKLFHHYKEIMISQPIPWTVISGDHGIRLKNSIGFVESINL